MNDEFLKSQGTLPPESEDSQKSPTLPHSPQDQVGSIPSNPTPSPDVVDNPIPQEPEPNDHPLDVLHNQTDPYHRAKNLPSPKPIRTYESDVAEILAKQKSSVVSIASAENDKKYSKKEIPTPPKPPVPPPPKPVPPPPPPKPTPPINPPRTASRPAASQQIFNKPPLPPIETQIPHIDPVPQTPPPQDQEKLARMAAREKLQQITEESNQKEEIIKKVQKTNKLSKFFFIMASLLFISAGLLGAYYFYLNSPIAPAPIVEETPSMRVESVLEPTTQKIINLGVLQQNSTGATILNELNNTPNQEGGILEIVPMHQVGTSNIKLTGSQFIEATNFRMPDSLKRSLTDRWMIGKYTQSGRDIPFIIFTSDFFQNSFAGMLRWESTMPDELESIFDYEEVIAIGGEDSSTTTASSIYGVRGSFTDKIIRNRDIRAYTSISGQTLFLYTFLDQNTIVITTSEDAIPALVDLVDKQTYIR